MVVYRYNLRPTISFNILHTRTKRRKRIELNCVEKSMTTKKIFLRILHNRNWSFDGRIPPITIWNGRTLKDKFLRKANCLLLRCNVKIILSGNLGVAGLIVDLGHDTCHFGNIPYMPMLGKINERLIFVFMIGNIS